MGRGLWLCILAMEIGEERGGKVSAPGHANEGEKKGKAGPQDSSKHVGKKEKEKTTRRLKDEDVPEKGKGGCPAAPDGKAEGCSKEKSQISRLKKKKEGSHLP